ncbi:MAG TPA: PhoH family protein [Gammaproteobacteria bacterium]
MAPRKRKVPGKRLLVLDTNVLMHDPTALFHFQEHDVYLPMAVLEELDAHKRGVSEVSRNVRQVSRFLDELLTGCGADAIKDGLSLSQRPYLNHDEAPSGRLYFQTTALATQLPPELAGNRSDNEILGVTLALRALFPDHHVSLTSKDINLRIKGAALGLHVEDYFNDQVLEDVNLLYSGHAALPGDFWQTHSKELASWREEGRTFYRVSGPLVRGWHPNGFVYLDGEEPFEAVVRRIEDGAAHLELVNDYRQQNHAVWGITARNREQNYALNLLLDPEVDFVTLLGAAGTGKTLLALAAGLFQTLDENRYREIIMTRVTIPVGEDIGFLPGTEEEKMTPWMGALMDNLEILTKTEIGGEWGKAATNDLLHNRIKIRSLNFMRGRTFLNKYIILDEAQNLTAKQMKTLITRAGPGTKVICLGNIAQIDTPYLTETSSGLTYAVDRFKGWEHSGHVTLIRGERSRLADYATENL